MFNSVPTYKFVCEAYKFMYVMKNADSNIKLVLQTSRLLLEHTFSETGINKEYILKI